MSDTSTYLGGLIEYTGLVNLFPDPNGTRYQFWDETIEVLVGIIIGKDGWLWKTTCRLTLTMNS